MSLSCALLATLLQQWARRYIRLTQLARTSPERRAQTRALYTDGVEKMHIPWAVEGLPTLLHLSLFLFFGGLSIFLFNVDVEVFTYVVCWIGLFLIVYVLITLLPLIRYDSPYYTPLSKPVWFLKASILYVYVSVFCFIFYVFGFISHRLSYPRDEYFEDVRWIFRGMEKEAEESVEEQSLDIVRILVWTTRALADDNSRGKFFEAIPGLFNSKLVKNFEKVPPTLLSDFWRTVDRFIMDTRTSNSVSKEAESRLVDIGMDIASMIPCSRRSYVETISDPKPVPIDRLDRLELMTRWTDHESPFVSCAARARTAEMLARMMERDPIWFAIAGRRWFEFAHLVSGLSEPELRSFHVWDNMLLATMIDTCRRTYHFRNHEFINEMGGFIDRFGKFDICHTLPRLQHDFCQLWNKLVQEARKPESRNLASFWIIYEIHRHYISLHPGTDPALWLTVPHPSSILLCEIPSHHPIPGDSPDPSPHNSTSSDNIVLQPIEKVIIPELSLQPPMIPSIIDSQVHAAPDSHSTDASPPSAVATVLQNTSPVAMVSYTCEELHIVSRQVPPPPPPPTPYSLLHTSSISPSLQLIRRPMSRLFQMQNPLSSPATRNTLIQPAISHFRAHVLVDW